MSIKPKSQEKHKMSEIDDQILKHFEIQKRLGKGAYGIVWKALDKKTNQIVAVKKIFDAFRNETDAQRTFREIMFLRAFRNHLNVIQLHSIYKASNNLDIYLSFEYMESDLHNVIKRGSVLKDVHKRYVMYQLLNAIKYIHSGNVIHRDLKPSNVLIDSKCRCKIADFGLARSVSHRHFGDTNSNIDPSEPMLTDYVATRWYRAPEILVASKRYTKGIDMWSIGCILGEMIRGKPLFPGSSTVNQIERIVCALPEVSEKDVAAVSAGFGSVLLNQKINSGSNAKLDDLLCGAPDDSKQLVKALLVLDPARRLTAKQALAHRYVEKFRHTIPEAELNNDVLPPFRDDVQLSVPEYRSKLYEIMQYNEKGSVAGGGGAGVATKQTANRKNHDISTAKLEHTILVSSSLPSANKLVVAHKSHEPERRASTSNGPTTDHNSRKYERKSSISMTGGGGSHYISASFSSSSKLTNGNGYVTNHSSSENKYKSIPKIKYCKIPNQAESKNVTIQKNAKSEAADAQERRYSSLNYIGKTSNINMEKRHSIDGSFAADLPVTNQSFSVEKKSMYGSCRNLNNIRSAQPERSTSNSKGDSISYATWSRKYLSPTTAPDPLDTSNEKNSASPPNKMKKNDPLNLTTDSSYYERRLRNLEERIQRHKMDINALFAPNTRHRVKKAESVEVCQNYSMTEKKHNSKQKATLNRSKSENCSSTSSKQKSRFDFTFSEGDRLSTKPKHGGLTKVPIASNGGDYGIVSSKELYELRKSQVNT